MREEAALNREAAEQLRGYGGSHTHQMQPSSHQHSISTGPPSPTLMKGLIQVLEAIIRAHGGELRISYDRVVGLSGNLVIFQEGDIVKVMCQSKFEDKWHPDPEITVPQIVSDDDMVAYVERLVTSGVTREAIFNDATRKFRHMPQSAAILAAGAVQGLIDRLCEAEQDAEEKRIQEIMLEREAARREMLASRHVPRKGRKRA